MIRVIAVYSKNCKGIQGGVDLWSLYMGLEGEANCLFCHAPDQTSIISLYSVRGFSNLDHLYMAIELSKIKNHFIAKCFLCAYTLFDPFCSLYAYIFEISVPPIENGVMFMCPLGL